ncbi:hypothetical protein CWC05_10005 [Pseudoalteromonas ruthenica]|uniref:OmpA-like domain-containing protein n=2 Tax=Pseudoalteromonas ruthenica TaxID=151081 RepID=A0A5S3Z5G6_9GAMM|nr:hypothetical protein CWC05_10005 [Pseudoalteromonas ruthenica]
MKIMVRLLFTFALLLLTTSSLAQSNLFVDKYKGGRTKAEAHYSYMPVLVLGKGDQRIELAGEYRAYMQEIEPSAKLGFSHLLDDVKAKLEAKGFSIQVYCVQECDKRTYARLIDDTFRDTVLYRLGYYNVQENRFGYLSAMKTVNEQPRAVMLFAKQERSGGLSLGYEQIASLPMPDAGLSVQQDFEIDALDFSQLKAKEKDAKGSADHPLIERFPGSYIKSSGVSDYEPYPLIVGQYKKSIPVRTVGGKVTTLNYRIDKTVGPYAVHKNYMNALTQAGFTIIYECQARSCGNYILRDNYRDTIFAKRHDSDIYNMTEKSNFYLFTAEKDTPHGKLYTSMYSLQRRAEEDVELVVDIIEEKGVSHVALNIDSDNLLKEIQNTGSVSLYGIEFDFNKHTIKPSSKAQLDEIAKFLTQRADVSLYVVGHTDNKGAFDYNQDLASRRAQEVVNTLVRDYQITQQRLQAVGVGPVAPLAANDNDDNMQRNRRVELVLKAPMFL